ncbi:MAG: hypothetical protein NC548_10870 [Lachnospiraceae bacterium]|nr:hypothetical protein [Lachnospiraceae bacterium]
MKRLVIVLSFICLFCTGCVTEENRVDILHKLEKDGVLPAEYEHINLYQQDASPIPDITRYDYTIKDKDGNLHMVQIYNKVVSADGNDEYWPVFYAESVLSEETEEHTFIDGEETVNSVTCYYPVESTVTRYEARKHKILLWSWWKLTEVN